MLGVLRPVVRDEHRAALGRVGMRPDEGGQLGLQDAARDRHGLGLAERLGVEPGRRLVAGLLPHRLVAPRPARRLRVVGVDHPLAAAAPSISSNWYSKRATSGAGAVSSQDCAAPRELVRQPVAELVREADGGEAASWIGELEADFDHGSVSIACQLTRRTVLSGRFGPFRTLGAARGRQVPRLLQAHEEDR